MKGLILRISKQMLNDKRSLVLILIAPILIVSLLYLLLGDSSYTPKITVDGKIPNAIVSEMKKQDVELDVLNPKDHIDDILEDKTTDAVISMNENGFSIKMLEVNGTKMSKVTNALKNVLEKMNPSGNLSISYLYGNADDTMFNSLGYVLLGILSFFFVFIISGISFVRERSSGTLERLMLTPISRLSVVAGYTVGFGIFAAIQSILIILYTKYALGITFEGPLLLAILIMILLAFTAVSMGALVSIFANSEFQVMQFIPVIIIPQMFFSGLIPIDTLPFGLGKLAYIMPVYYGCTALENVMIKGFGIEQIWQYLLILLAFILVLFIINTLALKKYRKI
jgi:ABC-2 type transport system permease protein